jgi:hypothetical protein
MTRKYKKRIYEGQYVAEVDIEWIDSDKGWAPLYNSGVCCEKR